jgi:hypothetical protein
MSDAFHATAESLVLQSDGLRATAESLVPQEPTQNLAGEAWDNFFRDPRKGLVNKAFNDAYDEAYGKQPLGVSPEFEKVMRDTGVWNDYSSNNYSLIKGLNEGVMRPAAAGMDAFMRTMYATARGAAATPWWSPAHPIGAVASAALEGAFPELMPHLAPVAAAKDVGVIGGRAPESTAAVRGGFQRGAGRPRAPVGATPEVVLPDLETREATPAPATIHEAARQLEPDLMTQYDALTDTKNQYLGMINELSEQPREPSPEARGLEASLQAATTERARGRIQERLAAQVAADEAAAKERVDSLRVEMNTVDAQLRDIAPDVADAYRRSRDMVPEPPPIEPTAVPEPIPSGNTVIGRDEFLAGHTDAKGATNLGEAADALTIKVKNVLDAGGKVTLYADGKPIDIVNVTRGMMADAQGQRWGTMSLATAKDESNRVEISLPQDTPKQQEIYNLLQRRPSIQADVTRQLIAAGRPEDEARADGALWQAHYEARANRFGGALGSARDIYEADDPTIKADEGRARGRFNIARNEITLMKDADASTFVHETGHNWLEELKRDSQHPKAPPDLIADFEAVKTWLGAEDTITKAQHEKFARGFERYLMEGVAPSNRLAQVFNKFRDWMTKIYQTVARLRAPINDQIRGVYDRLLSSPRGDTIIAPEREVSSIAVQHEGDLATSTPENALVNADRMRAERDLVASTLKTEIESARRRYRNAGASTRPTAEGGPGRAELPSAAVERVGPESERAEPPPTTTEVSPSGATFKAESTVGDDGRFGPTSDRFIDKAGNIRLDNLEAPDDVNAVIRATARYNNDFATERRGNVTPGQLLGLAEDLGQDPRWLDNKNIGSAFSYEEVVAARRLLKESANAVREQMIQMAEGGDPLEFAKAIARHEMIMGKVAGASAEWGRAGHAFRALSELTATSDFVALDQALRQTGRSYDELMQLARMGKDLPTAGQVSNVLRQTMMEKIKKGIVYVVTNGYLSGPFTHAGYAAGNLLRNIAMIPGTAFEAAVGTLRGAETDRVYWREVGASFNGLLHGTVAAWEPAYEAWKTGVQPPLPGQKRHGVALWAYDSPFPEMANKIIGAPGRAVAAIHQFARVQFYTQELYRAAVRDALDRGLTGQDFTSEVQRLQQFPTQDLMNYAADEADKWVFQQRIPYNSWFASLQRYTEDHPLAKVVFPFITVGYNIAKQTVRYSPLAPAVAEYRAQLGTRAAPFDMAAGKVLFGMSLLGTGIGLGLAGTITGPGPSEPKARSTWLMQNQPFSMKVGNVWIPIQGLGAHFNLLVLAAGMAQAGQYATKEEINDVAKNYWSVIMHSALDESVFHDFANIGKVVADPDREAGRYISNMVGGLVPFSAGLSQLNRHILDPNQKETRPGLEGVVDNVLSRIPGASNTLYDRRDGFGEQIPTRGLQALPYRDDPTVQWLARLQTGPARMDHTIEGVRLSPTQYDDLTRVSGRLGKKMLDEARPQIENAPRGMQVQEINRLLGQARHIGRQMLMMNYPQLMIDVTNEKYKKFQ